jgi:hypothetical protein
MKTLLANIWKRRWCRLLLVVVILCALPLLHPFVRQSIFGPTIDGIPWCVWENEFRICADPQRQESWLYSMLRKFRLIQERRIGLPPHHAASLPLYLHLAKDRDVLVRRLALDQLALVQMHGEPNADVVAIFRQRLQDDDPRCRLIAAGGVWRQTKDAEMKSVVLPLLDHPDRHIRMSAIYVLTTMAVDAPDLFDPLSKLTEVQVRADAISSLAYFGKRGLPILQRALRDPDRNIRRCAVFSAARLGKDAENLIPLMLTLQKEADPSFRQDLANALHQIDPTRFAKPAQGDD